MTLPRLSSLYFWRALFALCVIGFALFLGGSGCSSGAVCYRNTDCPVDNHCDHGQCMVLVSGDSDAQAPSAAGTAGVNASGSGGQ